MADKTHERDTVLGESSGCHFLLFLFIFFWQDPQLPLAVLEAPINVTQGCGNEET